MVNTRTASPIRTYFSALASWPRAFGYMRQSGLLRYHLAAPVVLAMLTWAGWALTSGLTGFLQENLDRALTRIGLNPDTVSDSPDAWWTDVVLWGATQLDWMIEWATVLLVLWIKLKLTKYVLLTLMAPFMSAVAAAVRQRETGHALPFSLGQLFRDLMRGVRTASVLLAAELALTLALALAGLWMTVFAAPLAVLLSPVLLLAGWTIGAYFYGAAVFDAVYEQSGLSWASSLRQGWADRGRLLGIGTVFSLLLATPYLGVVLAALMGPIPCTVAAARLTFTPSP